MKRTSIPIYKEMDNKHARESRGQKSDYMVARAPRFLGCSLRGEDLLRYSGLRAELIQNDVMAVQLDSVS